MKLRIPIEEAREGDRINGGKRQRKLSSEMVAAFCGKNRHFRIFLKQMRKWLEG